MIRQQQLTLPETTLHIVEAGDPSHPGILLLHGFPDCHDVWQAQIAGLSANYHVISFDMRGTGNSTPPVGKDGYRMPALMRDIDQVITATRGAQGQVHMAGHDWGSIIGWSFVADATYGRRVLSWTSFSGPHMGRAIGWVLDGIRLGDRATRQAALAQLAHSWYMLAMNIPGAGRAVLSIGGRSLWQTALRLGGVPKGSSHLQRSRQEVRQLTLNSFRLYQQNIFTPPPAPAPGSIRIPCQLVTLTEDIFLQPEVCAAMAPLCQQLRRVNIQANHWAPVSAPEAVTRTLTEFLAMHH
ncbi:MAG: alpha/beta fold hydrolase [Halomonadaceae bacterium]|nr:MAG: alpha/beta fold hydrolase [Halomonadaceae bacterium]